MNPKITSWQGRRVWIIGASTGIGAETARALLSKGALVALSARSAAGVEAIAAEAGSVGQEAIAMPLDITDATAVHDAALRLLSRWNGFDLVLVVAGTYQEMTAANFNLAQARSVIDVNLNGPMNVLDAVLPQLLKQKNGGIGIVGSVAGYSGLPKTLVYGPTKAAVVNLCESLYFDLRPQGIAVYLVSPGFVDTPLVKNNDFHMPALISATEAARHLIAGLEQGEFDIHFPKRFTRWLKFLRLLPYGLYFSLVHRFTGL